MQSDLHGCLVIKFYKQYNVLFTSIFGDDNITIVAMIANTSILDTMISVLYPPLCVTFNVPPTLDFETGWTGELWSKINLNK